MSLSKIYKECADRFQSSFDRRFGFGIWDSRAADGHRNEGITSTSVMRHSNETQKSLALAMIDEILFEMEHGPSRIYGSVRGADTGLETFISHLKSEREKIEQL